MVNTKFPPQRSKMSRIKGFGENVSQLPLCINVFYHYVSLLNMVSQEVVYHFYVFLLSCGKLGFVLGIWHLSYHT
jgi:hypothetical protein